MKDTEILIIIMFTLALFVRTKDQCNLLNMLQYGINDKTREYKTYTHQLT